MPTSSAEAPSASERETGAHLRVTEVSAGYGPVPVIIDVSIAVAVGEIVAVIGPNGAGKSTLLKTVLGILRPGHGRVQLAGRRIDGLPTNQVARLGVGYVPQVRDVFEPLTVRENLEMGGYTLPRREIAGRLNEVTTLFPALAGLLDRPAGYLSGGERKLLAVGRVLMRRPSLLVLDEPTAGLAPQPAHTLLFEHVPRLAADGRAVLLVEQHAQDALAVSHWAYVLASGRVQLTGPAESVRQRADLGDIFLGRSAGPASSLPGPLSCRRGDEIGRQTLVPVLDAVHDRRKAAG